MCWKKYALAYDRKGEDPNGALLGEEVTEILPELTITKIKSDMIGVYLRFFSDLYVALKCFVRFYP